MKQGDNPRILILGAGLAGLLTFLALRHRHPNVFVEIADLATGPQLNKTWSFHHADIPETAWPWLKPWISQTWSGYEVRFPHAQRRFDSAYYSILAEEFYHKVNDLQPRVEIKWGWSSSDIAEYDLIFDTTGWPKLQHPEDFGFQKFLGWEVELSEPHHIEIPVLKDVQVSQHDGYRFVYVLPLTPTRLLVEDTYYSNDSTLDFPQLQSRLKDYIAQKGWPVREILREEWGSLPLAFYPQPLRFDAQNTPPRIFLGAASGLFQPVTGYTLPSTVQILDVLMQEGDWTKWSKLYLEEVRGRQPSIRFYCMLNRMMFLAAQPERRFEILQRFYGLGEGLIERFYAGQSTIWDRIRILTGRPPVPLISAMKSVFKQQTMSHSHKS